MMSIYLKFYKIPNIKKKTAGQGGICQQSQNSGKLRQEGCKCDPRFRNLVT